MTSTPPRFTVRTASLHDAGVLATLRSALFREEGKLQSPQQQAEFEIRSAGSFMAGLERAYCIAWLAEDNRRQPLGSVAMLLFPRLPSPDSLAPVEGYLLSVYTIPEWRHHGVGAALVAAAVAKGRELGLGRIRLHTTALGQSLYAAAGFRARNDEMELSL